MSIFLPLFFPKAFGKIFRKVTLLFAAFTPKIPEKPNGKGNPQHNQDFRQTIGLLVLSKSLGRTQRGIG